RPRRRAHARRRAAAAARPRGRRPQGDARLYASTRARHARRSWTTSAAGVSAGVVAITAWAGPQTAETVGRPGPTPAATPGRAGGPGGGGGRRRAGRAGGRGAAGAGPRRAAPGVGATAAPAVSTIAAVSISAESRLRSSRASPASTRPTILTRWRGCPDCEAA